MKTLKFAFLFLAILSIAACTNDDDGMIVCGQSDWVGTYTGIQTCGTDTEPVIITITADGTASIIIEHVVGDSTAAVTTTYDPLPFDVCSFNNSASGGGLTVEVAATLSGSEITLQESLSDGTTTTVCNITATRN